MMFRNKFLIYLIYIFSNTYSVKGTTTQTTQITTYNYNLNKQNNQCIYNSYCFPIILTVSIVLFAILVVQCWQYYVNVFIVNKHSKKNKPITYVVSNVYEYNKNEDINNIYSEI